MKISVVVPLYHGDMYINKIIEQEERVLSEGFCEKSIFELIFVNDNPEGKIDEDLKSEWIDIHVVNNAENQGIQASRIIGLSHSTGEYIHFLDQDDEISPDFYRSQLKHIGDADAVYCRCYNGNRQPFNRDRIFETAFDKENIFSVCPVISPGQVLIRKDSIPEFWRTHVLKNIGSDDYFLWLCMYASGCRFAPNQNILYTHTRNGGNFSSDLLRTKKSDDEMVRFLVESGLFNEEDCGELEKLAEINLRRRYAPQMKDQAVLMVLSELLKCYENDITLAAFLAEKGINSIAIFGAAVMGERVKGLLKKSDISVPFYIDRNAAFIDEDIPVFTFEEAPNNVDAVLISNISGEEGIRNILQEKYDCPVFDIRTVVWEMKDRCKKHE